MKKVFLVAILAVAGMWSANAQKFGVKGGYNLGFIWEIDSDEKKFDFGRAFHGFHIGGHYEWQLTESFSLLPEIRYSRQSGYYAYPYYGNIYTTNIIKANLRLDYINLPVMAKFNLGDKFSILVGPQFGFLIDNKIFHSDGSSRTLDFLLNKFDFGIAESVMLKLENNLFFEIRFASSFTRVYKVGNMNANFVISSGVGYAF